MAGVVRSINGIPIRLNEERWEHITTEHAELSQSRQDVLETVKGPDRVLIGNNDELLAIREVTTGKWLVVVYRESADDGFVITAFSTRRNRALEERKVL